MLRRLALTVFFALTASSLHAMDSSQIPTRFPLSWGSSAVAPYIRTIPTASQIGIQNCAASLTDGFPPLTFVPSTAGGCPPFGQDFNGILKQITQWVQWGNAGGPVPWNSTFSGNISGYPKGAVVQAATFGQWWLNVAENNATNPDAAGANWQNFYVGWTGVTAGAYVRPQITVAADGKITAAANGTQPTRQIFTSGTGATYTTPAGAKRLFIRMVGGGGAGGSGTGGTPGNGGAGTASSFNSITAAGGSGGALALSGGSASAAGGAGGTGGTGTAYLRIACQAGARGETINFGGGGVAAATFTALGGTGGSSAYFGGGGQSDAAGVANTGGGGGGGSSTGTGNNVGIGGGGGGGCGEYAEIQITSPAATYVYTVGTGGTAGTGTRPGGVGPSGRIIVDEHYD